MAHPRVSCVKITRFCWFCIPVSTPFGLWTCVVLSYFAFMSVKRYKPLSFSYYNFNREIPTTRISQEPKNVSLFPRKKKSTMWQFQKGAFQVAYIISFNFPILKTTT